MPRKKFAREAYTMSPEDWKAFRQLPWGFECRDKAWEFWRALGDRLGFDYMTVLPLDLFGRFQGTFTALPIGHNNRTWCWPLRLRCRFEPKF